MPEAPENAPDESSLSWRSWPLVDEWPASLAKAAVVAVMCAAVGLAFGGVEYALLAAAFLKLKINQLREWPKPKPDKPVEHFRSMKDVAIAAANGAARP